MWQFFFILLQQIFFNIGVDITYWFLVKERNSNLLQCDFQSIYIVKFSEKTSWKSNDNDFFARRNALLEVSFRRWIGIFTQFFGLTYIKIYFCCLTDILIILHNYYLSKDVLLMYPTHANVYIMSTLFIVHFCFIFLSFVTLVDAK